MLNTFCKNCNENIIQYPLKYESDSQFCDFCSLSL